MKISALKYNLSIIILSIILATLDVFLILYYGLEGQFLIFLYVMIGIFPLCGIISVCAGMSPKVIIDKDNLRTLSVADERYKTNKSIHNTQAVIYFEEITDCVVEGNKLIIKLRYDQTKTLYLSFFTKGQIEKIKK